ncbi:MAG: hypothetical protein ACUZ8I_03990 [Candidatus Scalindua sp.]
MKTTVIPANIGQYLLRIKVVKWHIINPAKLIPLKKKWKLHLICSVAVRLENVILAKGECSKGVS